jgi:hypothetical protein
VRRHAHTNIFLLVDPATSSSALFRAKMKPKINYDSLIRMETEGAPAGRLGRLKVVSIYLSEITLEPPSQALDVPKRSLGCCESAHHKMPLPSPCRPRLDLQVDGRARIFVFRSWLTTSKFLLSILK